jgi:hypothetical protein
MVFVAKKIAAWQMVDYSENVSITHVVFEISYARPPYA